jgi:hypothetical protein
MNLLNASLIAIAAMLGVIVLTFPVILALWGWEAWQVLPREIYAREPQRVLGLRPFYLWIAICILGLVEDVFGWLHWSVPYGVAVAAGVIVLTVLLVTHLVWGIRIVRRGAGVDGRLRRFARYALWGSASGILIVAAILVLNWPA